MSSFPGFIFRAPPAKLSAVVPGISLVPFSSYVRQYRPRRSRKRLVNEKTCALRLWGRVAGRGVRLEIHDEFSVVRAS